MAEFMTTDSISAEIARIISDARSEVTLVSPVLKLTRPLYEQLKAIESDGVKITLICDRADLKEYQRQWLLELENLELYRMENLRAKCYFNEDRMLITSMEMHEYMKKGYREMGVLIKRDQDSETFLKAIGELESILVSSVKVDPNEEGSLEAPSFLMQDISLDIERIKEQSRAVIDFLKKDVRKTREDMKTVTEFLRKDVGKTRDDVRKSTDFLKQDVDRTRQDLRKGGDFLRQDAKKTREDFRRTAAFLQGVGREKGVTVQKGFCIRCGVAVDYDLDAPYCDGCYQEWDRSGVAANLEEYCHKCGMLEATTSKGSPLCEPCHDRERRKRRRRFGS